MRLTLFNRGYPYLSDLLVHQDITKKLLHIKKPGINAGLSGYPVKTGNCTRAKVTAQVAPHAYQGGASDRG